MGRDIAYSVFECRLNTDFVAVRILTCGVCEALMMVWFGKDQVAMSRLWRMWDGMFGFLIN